MSRYSLDAINSGTSVEIGYDPVADAYFLHVILGADRAEPKLKMGRGSGFFNLHTDAKTGDPEGIIFEAAKYAVVPHGLLELLIGDRPIGPVRVEAKPVVYAGMADNRQVWRYRPSDDPADGVLIAIRPAEVFGRNRLLAVALLDDFLRNPNRSRRLAVHFASAYLSKLLVNRPWLLTERDMANGIFEIESRQNLLWVADAECYAGEGAQV